MISCLLGLSAERCLETEYVAVTSDERHKASSAVSFVQQPITMPSQYPQPSCRVDAPSQKSSSSLTTHSSARLVPSIRSTAGPNPRDASKMVHFLNENFAVALSFFCGRSLALLCVPAGRKLDLQVLLTANCTTDNSRFSVHRPR